MRRIGRRGGADLDLTPLLDVIFIILMVVMCNQTLISGRSEAKSAETQARLEETKAENDAVKDQLAAMNNEGDLISYVTVSASYESDDPKIRHFKIVRNNNTEIEDIRIAPDSQEKAYEEIESVLTDFVKEHEGMPVLMVLDKEEILYRDYEALDGMLTELKDDYGNIYRTDQP